MERTRNLPHFTELTSKVAFVESLRGNTNAPSSIVAAALDDAARLCVSRRAPIFIHFCRAYTTFRTLGLIMLPPSSPMWLQVLPWCLYTILLSYTLLLRRPT
jgi:hypothetical protein